MAEQFFPDTVDSTGHAYPTVGSLDDDTLTTEEVNKIKTFLGIV